MHFNGQTFSGAFEQFSLTSVFWGLKCIKSVCFFFKEKMILKVVFIKLTFRWLQTGLSDLKKKHSAEILLMVDFYALLKMLHFSKFFEIFEFHQ